MATNTPNYNFILPTVGADKDAWGGQLNTNWSSIDTLLKTTDDKAVAADTKAQTAQTTADAAQATANQAEADAATADGKAVAANNNANSRVLKSGDTMTGDLVLPDADPATDNSAARKKYVDDAVAAVPAPPAIGVGQTWQDVLGSRAVGTSYRNITGKPIMVTIRAASNGVMQVSTDNVTWVDIAVFGAAAAYTNTISVIIPDTHYYRANILASQLTSWVELR